MKKLIIGFLILVSAGAYAGFQVAPPASGTLATGSTDNAVLRADGTGGSTTQSSTVTLGDTGAIVDTLAADVVGLKITKFAGASSNLTEWYDSTPTLRASISTNGTLTTIGDVNATRIMWPAGIVGDTYSTMGNKFGGRNATTYALGTWGFIANAAASPGMNVRGTTSQTAALQIWTDDSDVTLAQVTRSGAWKFVGKTSDPCADTTGFPADSYFTNTTNHVLCICVAGASKRADDGSTSCF